MAKRKLKDTKEIDGRLTDEQMARLNEIYPGEKHGYATEDLAKYQDTLDEMNLADLHNEAIKRGVPTRDSRNMMLRNLVKKFREETSRYKNYHQEEAIWTPAQEKKLKKLMGDR